MRIARTVTFGAAALMVIGTMASADIVGSAHDFSGELWSEGEICKPCHTPHNAMTTANAPLWNHMLPDINQVYNMHQGDKTRDEALDSKSVLCMACHDGTVALDSYGGDTGSQFMTGSEKLGVDLRDDHPIGSDAIYPDVSYMNDPVNWENSPHGFTLEDMIIGGLPERVVGCTTCHEPHKRGGRAKMLWVDNDASALCLTCHLK